MSASTALMCTKQINFRIDAHIYALRHGNYHISIFQQTVIIRNQNLRRPR